MDNTTITTERLILRRFSIEDATEMYELAKNPDVGPHAGWHPHESMEETEEVLQAIIMPSDAFAVTDRATGALMGVIAIEKDRFRPDANSGELGYWLGKEYWGKGYMTEAAKVMLHYAFTARELDQLGICTSQVNERSQSVIKKCGFTYEGTIRRTYKIYDGSLRDSLVFSMLKEEYLSLYTQGN